MKAFELMAISNETQAALKARLNKKKYPSILRGMKLRAEQGFRDYDYFVPFFQSTLDTTILMRMLSEDGYNASIIDNVMWIRW